MRRATHRARLASGLAVVGASLLLCEPALAQEGAEIATRDGRVRVGAEGGRDGDSGHVRGHGNVGAYHFDNSVEAGPDGFRLTNPPMYRAIGSGGGELEELYGPPVARASLGTGGLTAGIRDTGVLTNLSWPGPGYYEHVNYLQRTRGWRNRGAPENAGSFGGLLLPDGRGTWFTDLGGWRLAKQAYGRKRLEVLRTKLTHGRLGIKVTIRDVIHPRHDLLARRFRVRGAPARSSLAYYANLSPTTARVWRAPSVSDAVVDELSDFGTIYDGEAGAMLHFRPYQVDPTATTTALTGRLGEESTAAALDRSFGPGVYVAVGGRSPAAQFQAGLDAAGLARDEAGATPAQDPFYDARDGDLSGSAVSFGKTAGGQAWKRRSGAVYLAAAESAEAATALVEKARAAGFRGIVEAAAADRRAWLEGMRLPAAADRRTRAVAKRALMLIRTATDRRTGAIVANTTTQTPYRQDWLRDGAFFNYALLLAGGEAAVEMVKAHNDFYVRSQSETGHWDPILCTDGAHCSFAFPFEIDAQAFGVWALWTEYEFTRDRERLERLYGAIRKGAEVLHACRDPISGLQCYASEDDHVEPSQGAQGAATVYLGLRSAAAAARVVEGRGSADAARWDRRADEVREAAREQLCGERACPTGRGYMIWPGRLLTADGDVPEDPRLQTTLDAIGEELERRVAFELPEPDGFFQYPMEPLFALAEAWRAPDAHRRLRQGVRWLTHDVAEPGVLHFGERIFHFGEGEYLHGIGFPHVWSGAETYIAAAFVHGLGGPRGCAPEQVTSGATCPLGGSHPGRDP